MAARLMTITYRALLREARALTRSNRALHFLDTPSLETIVKSYGRGSFVPAPNPRAVQEALFPGVDFAGFPTSEMTGEEVGALVRASFRRGPSGSGSEAGLRHLAALNTLRALAPCSSVATTEVGEVVRVRTELTTLFLPSLALGAMEESGRFTYAYRVRVHNTGLVPIQILGRHWLFSSSRGDLMEVPRGSPGVVGHSPRLDPGMTFQYVSGVSLATPQGSMEGSFQAIAHDGKVHFDATVARAELRAPQ
jgi:ApaG protein